MQIESLREGRTDDAANREGRGNPQTTASQTVPTQGFSRRDVSGETENQASGREVHGKSVSFFLNKGSGF